MAPRSDARAEPRSGLALRIWQLWGCFGLALVLLAACLRLPTADPGPIASLARSQALAPPSATTCTDAGAVRLPEAQSPGDASWAVRRADHDRPPSPQLGEVETETEDEKTKSETPTFAPAFELVLVAADCGARRNAQAVDTGHLLVSTGLARGPPLA